MDSTQREDYLLGQVAGLVCAVQALLFTHPRPGDVAEAFEKNLEPTTANGLGTNVEDAYLEGLQSVREALRLRSSKP